MDAKQEDHDIIPAMSPMSTEYGPMILTLRVQSTQIWSIYGFLIRNRNYGLGYMLHIWVLGPLGLRS